MKMYFHILYKFIKACYANIQNLDQIKSQVFPFFLKKWKRNFKSILICEVNLTLVLDNNYTYIAASFLFSILNIFY